MLEENSEQKEINKAKQEDQRIRIKYSLLERRKIEFKLFKINSLIERIENIKNKYGCISIFDKNKISQKINKSIKELNKIKSKLENYIFKIKINSFGRRISPKGIRKKHSKSLRENESLNNSSEFSKERTEFERLKNMMQKMVNILNGVKQLWILNI